MREERKTGLAFGIILAVMMVAVELIGWQRVVVIWALLFVGSLVIKIVRVAFA
jgi:hypothetical protein